MRPTPTATARYRKSPNARRAVELIPRTERGRSRSGEEDHMLKRRVGSGAAEGCLAHPGTWERIVAPVVRAFMVIVFVVAMVLLLLIGAPVARAADGVPGPIVQHVAVVVDGSCSMSQTPPNGTEPKVATVRRMLREFLESIPVGTTVSLYTFDRRLYRKGSIELRSAADRERLLRFVDDVRADGSETHAWESIAAVLGDSKVWLDAHPGGAVQVFGLTDGEDTTRTDLRAWFAPYESLIRARTIDFNILTLGFELGDEVKKALIGVGADVESVPDLSKLAPPTVVRFDCIPARPVVGAPVAFRDLSSGWIDAYLWRFPDGSTSVSKAPTFVFTKAGPNPVTLEITDRNGRTREAKVTVEVSVPTPLRLTVVASATDVEVGTAVTFVADGSAVSDDVAWDFGDGLTGRGKVVTHVFQAKKDYPVIARAGSVISPAVTVNVRAGAVPRFDIEGPTSVETDEHFRLVPRYDVAPDAIRWRFDDGTSSDAHSPTRAIATAGVHEIVSEATYSRGRTATARLRIDVLPPASPVARLAGGGDTVLLHEVVRFSNASTGRITRITVDFGDQSPALHWEAGAGECPVEFTHVYRRVGNVHPRLQVCGPGGESSDVREVVVRSPFEPPRPSFTWKLFDRVTGEVELTNTTEGPARGFTWVIDGVPVKQCSTTEPFRVRLASEIHVVRLIAHPAPGLADVHVDHDITVPEPPTWPERHPWGAAGIAAAALASLLGFRKWRRARRLAAAIAEEQNLHGELQVLDGARWRTVAQVPTGEATRELRLKCADVGIAERGDIVVSSSADRIQIHSDVAGFGSPAKFERKGFEHRAEYAGRQWRLVPGTTS